MQKYKKYKKQYEKDESTFKSFDILYRKSLQDNVIVEIESELLCDFLLNIWMKRELNLFQKQ